MATRRRRRRSGRKSKFVTKRGLPFQLMKYQETKFESFFETAITLQTAIPATQVIDMSSIFQNVQANGRVGNQINVSGFYCTVIHEAALTGQMQWIRVVVVTPRITTFLGKPIVDMIAPIDPREWKVWYDRVHRSAGPSSGGNAQVFHIRKKFKPFMKVTYDNVSDLSVTENKLMFFITTQNNLGTIASYHCRLYFKDP